jgi:hypothetical protein
LTPKKGRQQPALLSIFNEGEGWRNPLRALYELKYYGYVTKAANLLQNILSFDKIHHAEQNDYGLPPVTDTGTASHGMCAGKETGNVAF